ARGLEHRVEVCELRLGGERPVAGHDPGLVVRELEIGIRRRDHAADIAAVDPVDIRIAGVGERVAGREHVGVGEIDVGVAAGVCVGGMLEHRLAAFDGENGACIAVVGFRRQAGSGNRRHFYAGGVAGGAGGKKVTHVDVRDDNRAVGGEARIAAGVVAVMMRVDQEFERLRRHRGDGRLELVVHRRELAVHHDDAVVAGGDGDVAARAFEHPGAVAEIEGLYLDFREIRPDRWSGLSLRVSCAGQRDERGAEGKAGKADHGDVLRWPVWPCETNDAGGRIFRHTGRRQSGGGTKGGLASCRPSCCAPGVSASRARPCMETWSRLRRLVLVVLAAAALCGCAQTHDEVNVGIGSAAFSVSPARPYAELYLPYAQMSALAYAQSSDVRGCPIANATRAPWLKELHGKGWHCVFGSAAFNVCPPGRQCGGGLTFHVWRKSDCAQIAIAFRGTDPNDIEDWLSNFRWFIPHRTWDEYDQTKYVQPAVMRRIAALGCRNAPIVAT